MKTFLYVSISMFFILLIAFVAFNVFKYVNSNKAPHINTFANELKKNKLDFGFYCICGEQGAGKTSLAVALMVTDYQYHGRERIDRAQAEIQDLITADSSYSLTCPDIAYRSSEPVTLDVDFRTKRIDAYEFGLPSSEFAAQYLPESTFLFFPELDVDLSCRKWKETPFELINGFKYLRHIDLTVLADLQVFNRLDIAIRQLATDLFYVMSKKDYYKRRKWWSKKTYISHTVWEFIWIKPQVLEQAKELAKYGVKVPIKKYYKTVKFRFDGDIWQHYDSFSGKAYWRKGLEDFYTKDHSFNDLSKDGIDQFCSRLNINKDGTIKKSAT